ncbi:MAG: hypothetical protein JNJ90_08470 [Saprospiraceae bacterium]|jgi:hypothetical protein|nr:hypothetical protein [Saprospiraceae bacterium]
MLTSFFERKIDPLKQAATFFGAAVAFMVLVFLLNKTGLYTADQLFPWSVATAFLLLFAVFNSMMSLNADSAFKYWGRSVYGFMGLAFANGMAAWLFSGVPLGQAHSYRWIYIVVTIGFIVFLTLVNLMRKIVSFAEKEEWNQPRQKRR